MKILCLSLLMMALASPAMAQEQHIKKVTPVLEFGAGISFENTTDFDSALGLASELSFGLDIRLTEKWSIMPAIGSNLMMGLLQDMRLMKFDGQAYGYGHVFANGAVTCCYHFSDGTAIGLGPATYYNLDKSTYFAPDTKYGTKQELKPFDFGLRASVTKECGKHWLIGCKADTGLRNVRKQYPECDITGKDHLFSICVTAGYRF